MKYAAEMGSGAMIYIPSFINISSAIQRLIGELRRQHRDRISLLTFFQNKKSSIKKKSSELPPDLAVLHGSVTGAIPCLVMGGL
jgi:hypothetical protein